MFNGAPGEAETTEKSACGLTSSLRYTGGDVGNVVEVGCREVNGELDVLSWVVTLDTCNE
jgi:hypothetical protein